MVALVAVTTAVRVVGAARLPAECVSRVSRPVDRVAALQRERLREVTGFSVFMLVLDAAYKVNYSSDVLVIGAMLGAPAVALWAPAQRLSEVTLQAVQSAERCALSHRRRLRRRPARRRGCARSLSHGTRLSLATVLPVAGGLALLAHPLVDGVDRADRSRRRATSCSSWRAVVIVRVGARPRRSSSSRARACTGGSLALVGLMAVGNLALSIAARPLARTRRGGARNGGAGRAHRGLWSVPDGVPARADVVRGALPQALWPALWPAVVAAALPRRQPQPHARDAAVGRRCSSRSSTTAYFALFLSAVGPARQARVPAPRDVLLKRTPRRVTSVGTANAS